MKRLYFSRTPRERYLVIFMLVVGLIIWGGLFTERLSATMAERDRLNSIADEQMAWLTERDHIRLLLQAAVEELDPRQIRTATQLQADVGQMARQHGLMVQGSQIQTARSDPGDIFSYNTVDARFQGVNIGNLYDFVRSVEARTPYIAIESITITPNRQRPTQLTANIRISSIELTDPSLTAL